MRFERYQTGIWGKGGGDEGSKRTRISLFRVQSDRCGANVKGKATRGVKVISVVYLCRRAGE